MAALDPLVLPAPAKLNLFLHITGRRADGYHELQTVFQLLDLADQVTLTPASELHCETSVDLGIPAEANLAYRAAQLLRDATGTREGVHIRIDKRIPDGGGLGGGSSDAASTLLGLNHLWGLDLPLRDLIAMGTRLGADVPVFVGGVSAWGQGIGDELTPLRLPAQTYVVVHPGCHVPTADVFRHPDLTRDTTIATIARFSQHPQPAEFGKNDLESIACALFPVIREALDFLGRWGAARMSGSGACVFLPVPGAKVGREIVAALPHDWQGWVVTGVNESPVRQAIA